MNSMKNLSCNMVLLLSLCCILTCVFTQPVKLVPISSVNNSIIIDLFLADETNFLGQALYPKNADAYIHLD